jgi:hypothetical protein
MLLETLSPISDLCDIVAELETKVRAIAESYENFVNYIAVFDKSLLEPLNSLLHVVDTQLRQLEANDATFFVKCTGRPFILEDLARNDIVHFGDLQHTNEVLNGNGMEFVHDYIESLKLKITLKVADNSFEHKLLNVLRDKIARATGAK